MKHVAYIVITYTVALALAGLALTCFGVVTGWLSELPGQRMVLFVLAFLLVIGWLHWNGPPRWWVSCLAWMGLYVLFVIFCIAVDDQTVGWLMIFTIFGIVPFLAVAAGVLGLVHWALTSAAFSGEREQFAFRRVLEGNPLAIAWSVAAVWIFVALVLEIMVGDPDRLYDFLRGLTLHISFDWMAYPGEQTVFRIILIGVMGLIGWSIARRIDAPPPWPHAIGFAVGGAIVAQFWDVPIYHPQRFWIVFEQFAGLYRLVNGAVAGAVCGVLWAGAAMVKREMMPSPG